MLIATIDPRLLQSTHGKFNKGQRTVKFFLKKSFAREFAFVTKSMLECYKV